MKRLLVAASLCLSATAMSCDTESAFNIPKNRDLKPGGIYVAYNNGCDQGCDQLNKGDLIQKIDGKEVKTTKDWEGANVTDGQPHQLEVLDKSSKEIKKVTIKGKGKATIPELKGDVPPVFAVGAEELNRAPEWARRRMFGHASPMVMLVSVDGGIFTGRDLYGQKRLIVYWDWGTQQEQANAVAFLQVLQKAQADLKAKGVDIMFVQVKFPNGRKAPMNDSDIRTFHEKWTVKADDGRPFPGLPMYRFPNKTEFNKSKEVGLEGAYTVFENIGASPAILLLDENGLVRWHSENVTTPGPDETVKDPAQYTIIQAVLFAQEQL